MSTFYSHSFEADFCFGLRATAAYFRSSAEGIDESPAATALAEQHTAWTERLPEAADEKQEI